jgi:excisionase family DNA binding protein
MGEEAAMTTRQVLDMLGCGRSTLYLWRQTRGFPAPLTAGRHARYDAQEVDRWMKSNKQLLAWLHGCRRTASSAA